MTSSKKITISDATVNNNGTDSKDYGINLNNVDTATVTNVTASSNASHGLLITASKGIHVSESTFNTSVGGYGIYCNDKTEAVFSSVICQQNYWSGMSMSDTGTKVTVTGGEYSQNGTRPDTKEDDDTTCAGIGAYNGATLTATEVVCKNNHGCGIALTGTKDKVVTSYLYGVTLNDNGDHGLGCRPYANVTITKSSSGRKNKLNNNKNHGILLNDHCTIVSMDNVTCAKNKKAGISVAVKSTVKSMSSCNFYENKEDGIHLSDRAIATIKKTKVYSNGGAGIGVYSKSTLTLNASNNVYKNKTYGLVAEAAKVKV